LTRTEVLYAALKGYDKKAFSRIAVKLVAPVELARANPYLGLEADGSQSVWVVAISGNYGLAPSFGCCSIPSDYTGKNSWGLAVIPDRGPAAVSVFDTSWRGDWPPYFDALSDLSAGQAFAAENGRSWLVHSVTAVDLVTLFDE